MIHGEDEVNPFLPVDVTKQAKSCYKWINENIWDLNRRQKEPEELIVEPGGSVSSLMSAGTMGTATGLVKDNRGNGKRGLRSDNEKRYAAEGIIMKNQYVGDIGYYGKYLQHVFTA